MCTALNWTLRIPPVGSVVVRFSALTLSSSLPGDLTNGMCLLTFEVKSFSPLLCWIEDAVQVSTDDIIVPPRYGEGLSHPPPVAVEEVDVQQHQDSSKMSAEVSGLRE